MEKLTAFLTAIVLFITSTFPGLFGSQNINSSEYEKVLPDTWAMTDGLSRQLSTVGEVKKKDNSKFVGLFYWTWHTNFAENYKAQNATEILKEHPEILYNFNSPLWEPEASYPDGRPYFWDEPLWGYYSDTDAYVLRKNAELIADAGVDVIIFDCTNGTATWDKACLKLFSVFEEAKKDGVNVPKIAYILPFDDSQDTTTSLKHLYNDIYSKGLYEDLWFYWDGKPLIMAHSSGLNKSDETEKEISEFFTFRQNEPTYFSKNTRYSSKIWGWCSDYPQTKFGKNLFGRAEEMCVSVAQNAASGQLVAMSADRDDVQGRSFTHGDYSYTYNKNGKAVKVDGNIENSLYYGLNFQQQWDYAIKKNPDFVFVTGWNEWIAGRWQEWMGTKNAFPDQFSPEFSRDIEPSNGILKDYYYCQLCENIRRYKGISNTVEAVDGVKTYYHYTNGTYKRDADGWVGSHYVNNSMRNDFVKVSVSNDSKKIYFTIETKENITPHTDNAWMRILIDNKSVTDENWEGFEYIINRELSTDNTVTVEKSTGGWNFEKVADGDYIVNGNIMRVEIPISALNLGENVTFNFKLSDNMQTDGDIMDFYKNGDVAPGGRFAFVY